MNSLLGKFEWHTREHDMEDLLLDHLFQPFLNNQLHHAFIQTVEKAVILKVSIKLTFVCKEGQ